MNSPLLGLDLGLKRTGVALSEGGLLAQPLSVIEAKPPHMTNVVEEILAYIDRYDINTLVIGVPYDQDEQETPQALKTEQVIQQLTDRLTTLSRNIDIVRVNEFHSTRDAKQLYPKIDKDSAAAALILQDYIDNHLL